MKEIVVNSNEAGQRMDKLLAKVFHQCSKSFLYKMLRKKNIKLNNQKAEGKEILKPGDTIQVYFSDETYEKFTKKDSFSPVILPSQFQVLYEDADIVLLNKWAGVLSQKAQNTDISMNEYLLSYLLQEGKITEDTFATFTPSVCNRLDRNTTGILIAGISLKGLQVLSKALKERIIGKYYYTLVDGVVTKKQHVRGYLVKEESGNRVRIVSEDEAFSGAIGTPVETEYEVVRTNGEATLLRVHLITGKTHQIRAHLSFLGHPVIGDRKYGDAITNQFYEREFGVHNQLLHAGLLQFPDSFELPQLAGKQFTAPMPDLFQRVLRELGLEME